MFKAYKKCEEFDQSENYEELKAKLTELAMNEVNAFFSIRDEDLPIGHAAKFTVIRFDKIAAMSTWYDVKEGLHTTECDGTSIQIGVETWHT